MEVTGGNKFRWLFRHSVLYLTADEMVVTNRTWGSSSVGNKVCIRGYDKVTQDLHASSDPSRFVDELLEQIFL